MIFVKICNLFFQSKYNKRQLVNITILLHIYKRKTPRRAINFVALRKLSLSAFHFSPNRNTFDMLVISNWSRCGKLPYSQPSAIYKKSFHCMKLHAYLRSYTMKRLPGRSGEETPVSQEFSKIEKTDFQKCNLFIYFYYYYYLCVSNRRKHSGYILIKHFFLSCLARMRMH